ncbi:LysR substrate-binding domain-containing protein [soil metagenome]
MFDLKQMRCFVAVGEELHFGRAAKRMNMTQPPLSRQIQLLEFELQITLLNRTSRSVRLTPAGKVFLRECVRILALAEAAAVSARRVAQGQSGMLRLGFTAGSSYEFLPKLLSRTSASLKDVEIVLTEMVSKQQIEAIRSNAIDVGLHRFSFVPEGFDSICVVREKMLLALPRDHRLVKGRLPTARDIAGEPFITFSPRDGYYFYHLIDSFFSSESIAPNYVQHVSQIHSILALVSTGMGVALIPESARLLRYRDVVLRQMKREPPYAELHLVWSKDCDNPALPSLVQLVRSSFAV